MRIGLGAQLLSYPLVRRGGIGSYIRNMLTSLPAVAGDRGHELHVLWGNEGRDLSRELGLNEMTIRQRFSRLPLARRAVRLPWEQLRLPFIARAAGLDVFHFLDQVVPLIPAAPHTVVTVHDLATVLFPETYGGVRARYKTLQSRVAVRRASLVIAISRATADDLERLLHVPPERIRVVHYGLNPIFRRVDDPGMLAQARARHSLPERFLVYVGTLEPRKNVERIIEGYALARQRHGVPPPLLMVGQKGWLYQRALSLPRELGVEGTVLFRDYLPQAELPALYSLADAFVFPTLYEGFGLPPLEAMACGTPVIASNVSAMPEVVGDAGLLVDPTSVDEIAAAIHRVTIDQDLRRRLAEAGPCRAAGFTWDRAARATVDVYEEATGW